MTCHSNLNSKTWLLDFNLSSKHEVVEDMKHTQHDLPVLTNEFNIITLQFFIYLLNWKHKSSYLDVSEGVMKLNLADGKD